MPLLVSPAAACGVDAVGRNDLSGVELDDGGFVLVDEDNDTLLLMCDAHSEVVHFSGSAERDFPGWIDVVVTDSVVPVT